MTKEIYTPDINSTNPYIKDIEEYKNLYNQSIENPSKFFGDLAKSEIDWIHDFDSVHNNSFSDATWFEGGKTNVSSNCIDRHLEHHANKTALIWEGDDSSDSKELTYQELHDEVCKFSNVLKDLGVAKGSRVCIYMPMIVEAAFAMLACTRIGAVHSVVFGGFSPESLKDRILDADCKIVITADEGLRGGKKVPLKNNVDEALLGCPEVKNTLVIRRTGEISLGMKIEMFGMRRYLKIQPLHVSLSLWTRKILYLFFTHLAQLENQKVSFILQLVTC